MLTLNDGRAELWQWDTGRTLAVDADCSQVHFSNKVFGRSIDVDVIDGAAVIPDVLLQTDKDLNVWAFVGTAENGYTKISKTFTVNRRNKPSDYVFTPTDQITLQTIQRQIGDISDLTTEAKENLVAAINEAAASGGSGSMDLRVADGYIQYSTDGGSTWQNLIAVAELKGADGITPTIGSNGNWYIGVTDTGKPSRGEKGDSGAAGKTAYAYAVEGGYTGTEEEFAAKLAEEMPDALPNPNPLTFTGAVTGSYDGSEALTVEIPSSGGEIPKPLTYDYMPDGYPKKSALFDIEWDGDTSGLVSVAGAYYKVADYTAVTKADLVGCMLSLQNDPDHPEPFAVEKDGIIDSLIPHAISVSDYAIFVSEPTSHGPYNFTESGIYFIKSGELYTARLVKQTITTMAEEFIPTMNVSAFTNDAGYITTDQLSDAVSVADIVDNLTTNVANKPLSAAQGVTLKALIDGVSVPDKLPNPNSLTFTGAVTGSYDGSAPLSVEIPSGGGGDNPLRLIKTVTLAETVKNITVDTDDDGNAFSLSEIYIMTNATNSEDQTAATSVSINTNGKALAMIGTTSPMNIECGKTGVSGRNWIWLISLNPLRALHGKWETGNISFSKTVYCYQTNEFNDINPNPYSVGEKITSINIGGTLSTSYLAAGSEFRIYGR